MSIQTPQMLTIKEVAQKLRLSQYYLRKLCKQEVGICVKSGVKYLINFEKLVEYLNAGGTRNLIMEVEK